ncbi:FtsX-like permease family protein [Candidatus Saccharibacteria bacterium]|nr:FtsX-like permease family protein [Candidatus Saccharibacteria bacterium]
MTKLLLIKLVRDMRTTWGRMVMMIFAISLSLIAFSTMLQARTLVQSNMTSGYLSTNPASARITINPGVAPEKIESTLNLAKSEPGIIDAAMRSVLSLKIQKDGSESATLQMFVASPDDPMRIATFKTERGNWPPPKDGILLEKSTLEAMKLKVGESLTVLGSNDKPVQLKITGSARDQSLSPASQDTGYGHISTNILPLLGKEPTLNQLAITVADKPGQTEPSHNRDVIVRTALSLADRLKQDPGVSIEQIAVPPPYEHPHQQIANALLTALLAFGALSLLLSAVLIATMFNGLLTQHIPQIGIMKAIGARSNRILQFYLIMILLVSAIATTLAFVPGIVLGRALADLLLKGALNIDVTSLSVPLWVYAVTGIVGIGVPLLLALIPLVRASRKTVREALDERGATDRPGRFTKRLYSWLGKLRGVDITLLMAFRNIFRRQARFLLSVGLLATAGAIFVGGLNLRAGFQAIPKTITDQNSWDVGVRLREPAVAKQVTDIVGNVPGVTGVETWNTISTNIQYPGKVDVTRTYPDQGHGSLNLTAIPEVTSVFNPPKIIEGRWLAAGDTDAIVLPQSIRKSLPDMKVGDSVQLPIDDVLTDWLVVGIAQDLAGGACPCVSQVGFEQASGQQGHVNLIRIVTDRHDKQARIAAGQAATEALGLGQIKAQSAMPIDALVDSAEGHSNVLIILIMFIAASIGIVGLIGLGSTMSTNVIERTREFGVMNAIGAPAGVVRRLVVYEGVFIAVVSCVVAIVPTLLITLVMGTGLGNLFFSAPVPFHVSLWAIIIWIAVVTIGATLATLAPAYRAARLTVREALAYL